MINQKVFADKLKLFQSLTAQKISPDMINALYERFKHSDEATVLQSIETMIHDDVKLTFGALKTAIKSKVRQKDPKPEPTINIDVWPEIQKLRMKALVEAIGKGSAAMEQLKTDQAEGKGIWDFTVEKARERYDCHENCDQGTVFYSGKDGYAYAGSCAICKRGPGKPAPLINPDNLQIIKWGCDRPPF